MTRGATLSALGHLAACPGSLSLSRALRTSAAALLGRAIHEAIEWAISGRGTALDVCALWADVLSADDAGRLAYLAQHLALPVPAGALAEVPLGMWPDGHVRRFTDEEMAEAHHRGLRYPDAGQDLSGTLDCLWAEPYPLRIYPAIGSIPEHIECPPASALYVPDWKTGDEDNVPRIEKNMQLRGAALLAARWTGATRVIPAIVFVSAAGTAAALRQAKEHRHQALVAWDHGDDAGDAEHRRLAEGCEREAREGRWEVGEPLDEAALLVIEMEIRAVLARARGESDDGVRDQRDEVREVPENMGRGHGDMGHSLAGHPIRDGRGGTEDHARMDRGASFRARAAAPLITGPQCEWCDSRAYCPAFGAEALNFARAMSHGVPLSTLTRSDLVRALGLVPAMRQTINAIEAMGRAYAEAHGGELALEDGTVLSRVVEPVESYLTGPTFDVLEARYGADVAREAFLTNEDRLKAAMREGLIVERLPRGAWAGLKAELEAYVPDGWHPPMVAPGAVVVTGREVWRRRRPALPAKGGDDGTQVSGVSSPIWDTYAAMWP